jgi:ubiquinone/menaquinone biosynthesis C-methylase UbiE
MADLWNTFNELGAAAQARLAEVLETRGADPRQQAMRRVFLSSIDFPEGARVLDVGCGTGVLTRMLAQRPGVAEVVGVDRGKALVERARERSAELSNVTYREGDGESLPFDDATFDIITFDSVLSHMTEPERALAEAFRVLASRGHLAVFDGDYATTTVAIGEHDPLQTCVEAMMSHSLQDRWLVRRLPALVRRRGFEVTDFQSHGFVDVFDAAYMLTIVDRGADMLVADGRIDAALAAGMKAEARRRVKAHSFFGHIAYASVTARKPGRDADASRDFGGDLSV